MTLSLILGGLASTVQAEELAGSILMTDSNIDALLAVDPNTGDRVQISGGLAGNPAFPLVGGGLTFQSPGDAALLPSGHLIVADGNRDRLFEVDPETGNRSTFSGPLVGLGPAFQFPSRFTFDPVSGTIYVADPVADAIFAVDPMTRDRTIVADPIVGSGPLIERPAGITLVDPNTLVVCDLDRDALFQIDIASGTRTIISGDPDGLNIGTGPVANSSHLAILNGDVVMNSLDEDVIIRVNRANGNRTIISGPGVGTGPVLDLPNGGIAVDDVGNLYVGEQDLTGILKVDPVTGDRTIVTSTGGVGMGANFISPRSIYALPMVDNTVFADGFESGDSSMWDRTVL